MAVSCERITWLSAFLFIWSFTANKEGKAISDLQINEQIRDREVRLVGENGEQLGLMSARDAQEKAR